MTRRLSRTRAVLLVATLCWTWSCGGKALTDNDTDGSDTDDTEDTATTNDSADTGEAEVLPGCADGDEAWEAVVAYAEAAMETYDVPGLAVAIVCDGQLAYASGFGTALTETDDPITPHTRFQLASTTKMFTAAAAMSLVDDKTITLDEPVGTWVPYTNTSDPYDEEITLHQLLSHTAGYPTSFSGADWSSYDLDDYYANNADYPLWAPPGAVYNYSNLGMSLAGLALEEATGTLFADLVEERVFGPAGMLDASMHPSTVAAEGNYATGHSGSASNPTLLEPEDSYYPTGYYGPMGGAWVSVTDLARWAEVHLADGGDVLGADSIDAIRTPQTPTGKTPDQSYGYGLFIDEIYDPDMLSHNGSVGGFLTSWMMVPDSGFGVFTIANCDWYWPGYVGHAALDAFVDLSIEDLSSHMTSSADWPDYIGTYHDASVFGTIEVAINGDALEAEFTDLGFTAELTGTYDDAYTFEHPTQGSTITVSFWRDGEDAETGEAEYFVTLYGIATRTE